MTALGVKFMDETGERLTGTGEDLGKVKSIDASRIHPAVADAEFMVMSDVTCPLTGPKGATWTFGKQKGATLDIQKKMEADMKIYAVLLTALAGLDIDRIPGAGAAGCLGAALKVFLHANMKSGIETVIDLINFDQCLDGVDLVVTGEGRIDWQSAYGKVPGGIGMRCKKKGVPVVAIVGGMGEKIFEFGIESIIPTINGTMDIEEALGHAKKLYQGAAIRTFRMLRVGMYIK